MLDLRLVQAFVAVAEELHFGRAAARLNISQPPLTKQVQQLERLLDARLFDRTKRNVVLTPAGRVFLPEAQAALRQAGIAIELVKRADRGETGHLAVGFIDASIYSVIPPIVSRFTELHPDVELTLTELRIPDQIRAVVEHRLDVGFIHPPVEREELCVETVLDEPLVVALPATHPLAEQEQIALVDLAAEALIQFPRSLNPSLYDEIIGLCHDAGFTPRIVREATPKQTIIGLVSVGLGVSLLPAALAALNRKGVVYRPLLGRNLSIDTSVIYRKDAVSPPLRSFLKLIREEAPGWKGM